MKTWGVQYMQEQIFINTFSKWTDYTESPLSLTVLFMLSLTQEENNDDDDDGEMYEDLDERWWENVLY